MINLINSNYGFFFNANWFSSIDGNQYFVAWLMKHNKLNKKKYGSTIS